MLKVTYHVSGLFSLRKPEHGHLLNDSYHTVMQSTVRGALLGQMIQLDGVDYAREHFDDLKALHILPQLPESSVHGQILMNRINNKGLSAQGTVDSHEKANALNIFGYRGMVAVEEIVFYIEDTLPDIRLYLGGIHILGDSESLVGLASIEDIDVMTDVFLPYHVSMGFDVPVHECWDWQRTAVFDDVYGYSHKRKGGERVLCAIVPETPVQEAIDEWEAV